MKTPIFKLINTYVLGNFLCSTVARAPRMYSAFFSRKEGSSCSAWLCKEAIRLVLPAIPMCTSLVLFVGGTSIDGEKKRCLMVVKCIESSFKRKTKSGVTNDNNKELEKLILPFGGSFPLQSCISMTGRIPASTQEREVSVVMQDAIPSAMPVITLPDTASFARQMRGPLSTKPSREFPYTLLKSGLARALFSAANFLSYMAKKWEVSFYGTGGCCGISGLT